MTYAVARLLQLFGLLILPLAVAGNLAEIAGADHALDLKQALLLSGVGILLFYAGWLLQPRPR